MCAKPLAPPPLKTSPMRGRFFGAFSGAELIFCAEELANKMKKQNKDNKNLYGRFMILYLEVGFFDVKIFIFRFAEPVGTYIFISIHGFDSIIWQ